MAIGKRYPRLVFAGLIFAGSHATAGNLSLYSIDGGTITEGMVNITTGDGNVAIGANALAATTSGSNNVAIGDDAFDPTQMAAKIQQLQTLCTQIQRASKRSCRD